MTGLVAFWLAWQGHPIAVASATAAFVLLVWSTGDRSLVEAFAGGGGGAAGEAAGGDQHDPNAVVERLTPWFHDPGAGSLHLSL